MSSISKHTYAIAALSVLFIIAAVGGADPTEPPQPYNKCKEQGGSYCSAVQNFCDNGIGSCKSCVANAPNASCSGAPGNCSIDLYDDGCGNQLTATCIVDECLHWQQTQLQCNQLICE